MLGHPNPANPLPPVGAIAGQGATMPGNWQQQGAPGQIPPPVPGPGGAPPQMVSQGFMVAANPGGQQAQMYPQMYGGPAGGVPGQRPQNGQGGNMPPQQQQQPMVFNQQGMINPSQGMAMPAGIVAAQGGQNPQGVFVPKFGAQVVPMVIPAGAYNPQGFVPQGAVQGQGQPGGPQPGPQAGGPQQGQMMQPQGQMMQTPYQRHMGGGGPPHQMPGHEG